MEYAVHIYNCTPIRRLKWQTPYEALNGTQPDVKHLHVFGCGAYVHIPVDVRLNKMSPKSELMTYLGPAPGGHGNLFMRSPNDVVFTSAHALFDEAMFPKCSTQKRKWNVRIGDIPPPNDQNYVPDKDDDDKHRRPPPNKLPERRQDEAPHDEPAVMVFWCHVVATRFPCARHLLAMRKPRDTGAYLI